MPHDVLEHHDGIVHHETHRQREGHQRQVVEAVAQHPHHRAGADQGKWQGQRRNERGTEIPEEQEDHHHHQRNRKQQRELHIVDAVFNRDGAIVNGHNADTGRQLRLKLLEYRIDPLCHINRVHAGLPDDGQRGVGAAVDLAHATHVLQAVDNRAQLTQSNGCPVAHGHHEVPEFGGIAQLTRGLQRERLVRSHQHAGRRIGVPLRDGRLHFVNPDAARRHGTRIQLHTHRILGRAIHLHLRNTGYGGHPLREECFGVLAELLATEHIRVHGKHHDRRIGCVRLAVRRRIDALRQLAQCFRNGRLHIAGGLVDVTIQREQQRDIGTALRTGRRDAFNPRHRGERLLQRSRHRRGHHLGAGTRQPGRHRDSGIVDGGQVTHR